MTRSSATQVRRTLWPVVATIFGVTACDPITSVQGRVVRAPGDGQPFEPVADATVNVRCESLELTSTTDATGAFEVVTVGGTLPDACSVQVSERGVPVTTTIGAAKTVGDDPDNRIRKVEIALPSSK